MYSCKRLFSIKGSKSESFCGLYWLTLKSIWLCMAWSTLLKLRLAGVCGSFYKTLKNMYRNISCTVKYDNRYQSQLFPIESGVREGDVLSPLLFNIFLNDIIPLFQQENSTPPCLINTVIRILLYADDLIVPFTTEESLQNSLKQTSLVLWKLKLDINLFKWKIMCTNKGGRHKEKDKKFVIEDNELQYISSYTYKGEYPSSQDPQNLPHRHYMKKHCLPGLKRRR